MASRSSKRAKKAGGGGVGGGSVTRATDASSGRDIVTANGLEGALPAAFAEGRTAEELLTLADQLSALTNLIRAAGREQAREERAAAEAVRLQAQAAASAAAGPHNAALLLFKHVYAVASLSDYLTLPDLRRIGAACTAFRDWSRHAISKRAGVLAVDAALPNRSQSPP